MNICGKILSIAVGVLLSSASFAEGTLHRYRVVQEDCPVKFKKDKTSHWQNRKNPLKAGMTVIGKPSKNEPNIIIFKLEPSQKTLYSAKLDCTFSRPAAKEAKEQEPVLPEVTPVINTIEHKFYVSFGLMSWQESLGIHTPDDNTYALVQTSIGVCAGGGWEFKYKYFDFGLQGCGMLAQSEIARDQSTALAHQDILYRVTNVFVYGAQVGPLVLFRPFAGNVAIGISVPVILRVGNWPDTRNEGSGELYTVGPKFAVWPAPFLEARLEREPFFLSQKIGLYRSFKGYFWLVQGNFIL